MHKNNLKILNLKKQIFKQYSEKKKKQTLPEYLGKTRENISKKRKKREHVTHLSVHHWVLEFKVVCNLI